MATGTGILGLFPRAWYAAGIEQFLSADRRMVLGELARNSDQEDNPEQRQVWDQTIELLQAELPGLRGHVSLEFNIPRMGHRADAVLLLGATVVVLEFKFHSAGRVGRAALDQVWDYALELKYFHQASRGVPIVPIVVAAGDGGELEPATWRADADGVYLPQTVNRDGLRAALVNAAAIPDPAMDAVAWYNAPYYPSPDIVEAARALYARHTVAEIAYAEAGQRERAAATDMLRRLARTTRERQGRTICFLTGVPGAGKTLVGLDLATDRQQTGNPLAVFLSGNGPLVAVLRAALERDERERARHAATAAGPKPRQAIKSFIQNIHAFRREAMEESGFIPPENVVVFDEAQRLWNREKLSNWLARRKKPEGFDYSEPEFLIETMARRTDWAMIVCLVGEGQEINSGETGIGEWFRALAERYPGWRVFGPPEVAAIGDARAGWKRLQESAEVTLEPALHLRTFVRSKRAENLSHFVNALLQLDRGRAAEELARLRGRYPLALTRDLEAAKRWVRERAGGGERYGMLATSRAVRLKPLAVDVRLKIDPVPWFLNPAADLRSSYAMEDAATEFDIQGLEIDWACVAWDADLRMAPAGWSWHNVRHLRQRGTCWTNIHNAWNQTYVCNAYRVLLTRARRGMAICVPAGNPSDPTRLPEFYDATYQYLRELGMETIAEA